MNLDLARTIADAVMMEGYALYPFRASAPKNRFRWAFGVLAPRAWSSAGGCEAWQFESQMLVAGEAPRVRGELRFFQIEQRRIEVRDGAGDWRAVESAEVDGELVVAWDEGVAHAVPLELDVADAILRAPGVAIPFAYAGATVVEPLGTDGTLRRVRERRAVAGRIAVRVESVPTDGHPLLRLAIRIENTTPWSDPRASRDIACTAAFASTHLVLGAEAGELISLTDPPAWAEAAAAACTQRGLYPVLAGPLGTHDLMLVAPFIMNDHPQIAPESYGDFCDATEIDEMLTLRTLALTDDEKRHARATDPRAAAIIDRTEALPEAWRERLHGALRDVRGAEMVPRDAARFPPGCRVRLRPGPHTDAQDLLYAGMLATVVEQRFDVDGRVYLAVTVDDDPAAELHHWYGRYHHYRTDEVELV
jgi:hypothetical protein